MTPFDTLWATYPRRVAKLDAMKAWDKALKLATADEIIAGAQRYAAIQRDPQFTKHPASWLNKGCWMDEEQKPSLNGVAAEREKLRQEIEQGQRGETSQNPGRVGGLQFLDWEGFDRPH